MAEHPRSQPARLLVLGAGAAQLGLLEAAAARDLTVIAVDRDPLAAGFALRRRARRDLVRGRAGRRAPRPRARASTGSSRRVRTGRSASRPGSPNGSGCRTRSTAPPPCSRPRRRDSASASPQPACSQPRTFSASDPAIPFPCVVKAPDRQGQRGLTLVREPSGLAAAVEAAVAESRGGGVLVEELIDGPELTVNAVSRGRSVRSAHGHRPDRSPSRPRSASRSRTPGRASTRPTPWSRPRAPPSRRSGSRTGRATPRSGSARTGGRTSSRSRPGSAAATTQSSAGPPSASTSTTSRVDFALGDRSL